MLYVLRYGHDTQKVGIFVENLKDSHISNICTYQLLGKETPFDLDNDESQGSIELERAVR